MSYTMYTPLNVWLDPASVADVVAYIQTYLSENTIYSETEIETIIHDYLIAHPELIGGVQSVNGKTGTVVLSASDINTTGTTTIQAVLTSLSSQISDISQTVTGLDTRITANATGITNEATARANADTVLGNKITALQGAVGSPLVATTASAMTDTSKIYVYTGSETGYTNGNWYYYNGSEWTSGGVYNAVAINTDTTLTVAGMAADAKTTGDKLNDVKSSYTDNEINISEVLQTTGTANIVLSYEQGSRSGDTPVASNARIRSTDFPLFAPYTTVTFTPASGYKFELDYLDIDGKYISRYGSGWNTSSVTVTVEQLATSKRFGILIAPTANNTNISPNEGVSALAITAVSKVYSYFSSEIAKSFKITRTQTINNTSVFADANNAPVNTAFNINNTSGTNISNLPAQTGTLISYNAVSNNTNTNFEMQLFVDVYNHLFHRSKFNNAWSAWEGLPDNAVPPVSALYTLPSATSEQTVMLIGDSITQGQGSTGYITYTMVDSDTTYTIRGNGPDYPEAGSGYQTGELLWTSGTTKWYEAINGHGWGQLIKAYYENKFNCSVLNYGMSGINTTNLLSFINDLVIGSNADTVIVMIGANDRSTNSLSTYYSNLKSACNSIITSGKNLILMSEPPVSVANDSEVGRNFHMEDVSNVTMKVASELGVQFIPVYEDFLDYCDMTETTIDSLLTDGQHPNDNGYELLFKIITKHLGLSRKRPSATW